MPLSTFVHEFILTRSYLVVIEFAAQKSGTDEL